MREQNSAITMNRRETLRLPLVAALTGMSATPARTQAMQDIGMRATACSNYRRSRQRTSRRSFCPASCTLRFAPAERPSLFFIKATGRRCSFCTDIPRLTLPGTKWRRDSPSVSQSTCPICEDTAIRAARPTGIATSITRSGQWRWTRSRRCGIFGHEQFLVGARDRGARVAHRLCLDFPKSVKKVCLMDIAPTLPMYRQTNQEFATKYIWWFFLIQAASCQSIYWTRSSVLSGL